MNTGSFGSGTGGLIESRKLIGQYAGSGFLLNISFSPALFLLDLGEMTLIKSLESSKVIICPQVKHLADTVLTRLDVRSPILADAQKAVEIKAQSVCVYRGYSTFSP